LTTEALTPVGCAVSHRPSGDPFLPLTRGNMGDPVPPPSAPFMEVGLSPQVLINHLDDRRYTLCQLRGAGDVLQMLPIFEDVAHFLKQF